MIEFFSTTLGLVVAIGGFASVVVVGILYAMGLWSGKKDQADDRLITILQTTVTELEKKVDNQKKEHDALIGGLTKKIDNLTQQVNHLEKENETLTKVLQGRDEQTQQFYKKAFEAIEVGAKTHAVVEQMAKQQTELMKVLIEHLKPGVTVKVGTDGPAR